MAQQQQQQSDAAAPSVMPPSVSACFSQLASMAKYLQGAQESDSVLSFQVRRLEKDIHVLHRRLDMIVFFLLDLTGKTEVDFFRACDRLIEREESSQPAEEEGAEEEEEEEKEFMEAPWLELLRQAGPLHPVQEGENWMEEDPRYKFIMRMKESRKKASVTTSGAKVTVQSPAVEATSPSPPPTSMAGEWDHVPVSGSPWKQQQQEEKEEDENKENRAPPAAEDTTRAAAEAELAQLQAQRDHLAGVYTNFVDQMEQDERGLLHQIQELQEAENTACSLAGQEPPQYAIDWDNCDDVTSTVETAIMRRRGKMDLHEAKARNLMQQLQKLDRDLLEQRKEIRKFQL